MGGHCGPLAAGVDQQDISFTDALSILPWERKEETGRRKEESQERKKKKDWVILPPPAPAWGLCPVTPVLVSNTGGAVGC